MSTIRVVTQRTWGGPEVLELAEIDRPAPGPGTLLVRVHAAGVNAGDRRIRSGAVRVFGDPPLTLGTDFSGVVAAAGDPAGAHRPGDEVFGWVLPPHGSYAEYVVAPVTAVAAKPAAVDHVHAAALPIAGLTALQALERAGVERGQRVLVHGAAGGVGHFAVQLAKRRGAYVVGTARAAKHAFLRELGADELLDHTAEDVRGLRDIDIVLDTVSGEPGFRTLETLVEGGVLVDVVGPGIDRGEVVRRAAETGRRFVVFDLAPSADGLAALAALVDEAELRPVVEEVLPLAAAGRAHELADAGQVRGKVVLVP